MAGVKPITLGRIFSTCAVGIALLGCPAFSHAKSVPSAVTSVGENTFSLTRTARTALTRDTDVMRDEVKADAEKYCAGLGKQMKILELTSNKPFFGTGYANATIVFKALTASEMEQANAPAPASASASAAPAAAEHPGMTGDLYNDLSKLDELRKKGILTEKEFQSEKKKVLARSK